MVWLEWQMKNEDLMAGYIIGHNIIMHHLSLEQPRFISIRNIIGRDNFPRNSFIPVEHNAWHLSDIYFKWLRLKINAWQINYLIETPYQRFLKCIQNVQGCQHFPVQCNLCARLKTWNKHVFRFSETAVSTELRVNCGSCVLKDVVCWWSRMLKTESEKKRLSAQHSRAGLESVWKMIYSVLPISISDSVLVEPNVA